MYAEESQENEEEEQNIPEISDATAVMHLVKSYIGTGLLSISWAMKHTGLVLGPVLVLFLGITSFHGMYILVKCSKYFCRRNEVRSMSYSTLMMNTIKINPIKCLQCYADAGKVVVDALLITLQLGICSVLLVFIGQNVRQVFSDIWLTEPNDRVFIVMVFIPLVVLSFIKNLKIFAWFSFTANITTLASTVLLMWYIGRDLPLLQTRPLVVEPSTIPIFIGTCLYAFEGISMVLPIENEMKNPENFNNVLCISGFIICSSYIIVGFIGFLKFGFETCGTITLNILPVSNPWAKSIKLLFSFSVFVNWLLQFYVILGILFPFFSDTKWRRCKEAALRISLASFICIAAVAIPDLGGFMSLVGAFVTSLLGFILPAVIELMIQLSSPSDNEQPLLQDNDSSIQPRSFGTIIKDLLMIFLGLTVCVIGTVEAIKVIVVNLSTKMDAGICSGGKILFNQSLFSHHN